MPKVEFEPTISTGELPQTYALRTRGQWDRRLETVVTTNIEYSYCPCVAYLVTGCLTTLQP
jgi:hypothetical protein